MWNENEQRGPQRVKLNRSGLCLHAWSQQLCSMTWFIQNFFGKNQGLKLFFQGLLFPNNMKSRRLKCVGGTLLR